MAEQKKPSPYKQGEDIKNWLNKTGPIFLKDIKQYIDKETYNAVYKAYWDAAGATSVDRLKKYKVFENLLNNEIFDEATENMAEYNEFIKEHPEKAGVFKDEEDKAMFDAYETMLKFKKSMPTKEHNYENISLDHYVENNGQGYTPDDMKYLAGLYGLDYENAEDRSEFNKAIAKVTRQKQISKIMHPSIAEDPYGAFATFMLPVATAYAENNIDNLQGDFEQSFNPLKMAKTFKNNPGLAVATAADVGTNMAMAGAGGTAGKHGLAKAGTLAYNYAAAPAIREAGHVAVGNKTPGRAAIDFGIGGVGTNIATPKLLYGMTVKPTASAWRWAEGKGAASKTMQQNVNEAAIKAAKTERDMANKGQITAIHGEGGSSGLESEVRMLDKKGRPLLDAVKDEETGKIVWTPRTQKVFTETDRWPEQTFFTYIGKDGLVHKLTTEEILKLKRGEKLTGNASNVSLEDIIPSKEFDEYALNSPLIRRSLFAKEQKATMKDLYENGIGNHEITPERRKFLENSEGFSEYTPYEYAASTGAIESPSSYIDRVFEDKTNAALRGTRGVTKGGIAEAFGTGAKNYTINALGKPEYGGRMLTNAVNAVTSFADPDAKFKYTYGGEEKDATTEPSKNELALYTLQYKKFLENPEYFDEPERPDGYSAESIEKLKQSIKSVFGSKK